MSITGFLASSKTNRRGSLVPWMRIALSLAIFASMMASVASEEELLQRRVSADLHRVNVAAAIKILMHRAGITPTPALWLDPDDDDWDIDLHVENSTLINALSAVFAQRKHAYFLSLTPERLVITRSQAILQRLTGQDAFTRLPGNSADGSDSRESTTPAGPRPNDL